MPKFPLLLGKNHCYYIETKLYHQKERFLIDTGFSSYLCLSSHLKSLFPKIDTFITFDTEFVLADSSRKIFKQYAVPQLTLFNKTFVNITITFNEDENIIGVKLLEKLNAELTIDFLRKQGEFRTS